ncbi:MAG: response regulator [Candidatus Omnitrophota bacterium]
MKKILIVDDEPESREILKKKLEQNQYEAITASGGQEALGICQAQKVDLILLDIAMPGMDGYQTCEKLKQDKSTQDISVLFLTAKDLDPEGMAQRYDSLGACGYLSKPLTFTELLAKIKQAIGD